MDKLPSARVATTTTTTSPNSRSTSRTRTRRSSPDSSAPARPRPPYVPLVAAASASSPDLASHGPLAATTTYNSSLAQPSAPSASHSSLPRPTGKSAPSPSTAPQASKTSSHRRRRSSVAHAASGSIGSIKDGIGSALNLWSSRDHERKRSVDSPGRKKEAAARSRASSIRQLGGHKRSPSSTASGYGDAAYRDSSNTNPSYSLLDSPEHRDRRLRSDSGAASGPAYIIPPIESGPALHQALFEVTSSASDRLIGETQILPAPSLQPPPVLEHVGNSSAPGTSPNRRLSAKGHSPRKLISAADSVENLRHRRNSSLTLAPDFHNHPLPQTHAAPLFESREPTSTGAVLAESQQPQALMGRAAGASLATERSLAPMDKERESETDNRRRREKDKKKMLSRALQKAHAAVVLDNEQNFEAAIDAYGEACELLHQVLVRSSGEDDRRKLDAIRTTYENRIIELRQTNPEFDDSSTAPSMRQMSNESLQSQTMLQNIDNSVGLGLRTLEPAAEIRPRHEEALDSHAERLTSASRSLQPPSDSSYGTDSSLAANGSALRLREQMDSTSRQEDVKSRFLTVQSEPMTSTYMPPPLSPRRLDLENRVEQPKETLARADQDEDAGRSATQNAELLEHHSSHGSGGAMSWLDTIEESGPSSCASSVHSVNQNGLHRKRLHVLGGDTEAEFDAALDAAVEAAYGDDLEPFDYREKSPPLKATSRISTNVMAREKARYEDREDAIFAAQRQHEHNRNRGVHPTEQSSMVPDYMDDDFEEEERLLEELKREFGADIDFGSASPPTPQISSPPKLRQSDSSGFSERSKWHSSVASSRTTAGTPLSTVTEDAIAKGVLPRLDEESRQSYESRASADRLDNSQASPEGIRSRRLSGQMAKQLKIETAIPPVAPNQRLQDGMPQRQPSKTNTSQRPPPSEPIVSRPSILHRSQSSDTAQKGSTGYFELSPQSDSSVDLPKHMMGSIDASQPPQLTGYDDLRGPGGNLKSRPSLLRKNKSAMSLKYHATSVSSPDDSEPSTTPMGSGFFGPKRRPLQTQVSLPAIPSSYHLDPMIAGGSASLTLFDSDIHSSVSPGEPNAEAANAPTPLEPCPEASLLRPFWLLRALYQTLSHPRGGYLSTKLFVPRDVWRVKGVKLKSLEEKIAACETLSAALSKLGTVDTLDADAVLEEMQALEQVMESVQQTLTKKLGSDVGVSAMSALLKQDKASPGPASPAVDIPGVDASASATANSKQNSAGKSSYLSSWRKLRSKSSAANLTSPPLATNPPALPTSSLTTANVNGRDSARDGPTMATLPMTSLINIRFAKRDFDTVDFEEGPNRNYMVAIARLCDRVQVVDQIARQVEDPGLKFSSSTHVGLELSTRHAAEFFGFYVCRFVLGDLGVLLDKFIKRGSEWVLV